LHVRYNRRSHRRSTSPSLSAYLHLSSPPSALSRSFIVDITFNFFLPYTESIQKGGGLVKDHRLIIRHYLRGWFPLDFVSVIPVDLFLMAIDTSKLDAGACATAHTLTHASCTHRAQ
jgi:hypothetical protein